MAENKQPPSGFKELLNSMMKRRWFITAIVLGGFMIIMAGIFAAIMNKNEISGEWKELLLLLLGAFIGSYGKIIDYWFSDTDKDKMLVQKMDEEDGTSLSHTNDMKETNKPVTPLIPDAFVQAANHAHEINLDGKIDVYFAHRQCEHIWGDSDNDGDLECLKCGKIKDEDAEQAG